MFGRFLQHRCCSILSRIVWSQNSSWYSSWIFFWPQNFWGNWENWEVLEENRWGISIHILSHSIICNPNLSFHNKPMNGVFLEGNRWGISIDILSLSIICNPHLVFHNKSMNGVWKGVRFLYQELCHFHT